MNIYEKIELNKELVLKIERSVSTAWARKKSTDEIVDEIVKAITDRDQALQLQQTGVMQRYFHPFVGAGTLIKETEKSLVIKLDFNGKEYFAPKHEFTELL